MILFPTVLHAKCESLRNRSFTGFHNYSFRLKTFNTENHIILKLTWDLQIFVHMPGDEMWLSYFNFPLEITYFQLDVNNTNGMRSSDIILKENEIIAWDKPKAPCKSYLEEVNILKLKLLLCQYLQKQMIPLRVYLYNLL